MLHSDKRLYVFNGFRLDPAERLLLRDGTPVPLTPKAFEMLIVLASNSGRLLSKEELMRAVWGGAVVEENNLDKNISALRKALSENGAERKFIETVRGHGYRFNATVTEIAADHYNDASRVIIADEFDLSGHSITSQQAQSALPRRSSRHRRLRQAVEN